MTFGEALLALFDGKKIQRKCWFEHILIELSDGCIVVQTSVVTRGRFPYVFTDEDKQATDWQEYRA